jgi:hypothetical protein
MNHVARKAPSLIEGVAVAAVLALAGGAVFGALKLFVAPAVALRCLTILLGGAYSVYLLTRSSQHGRVAAMVFWCGGAGLAALLIDSLAVLLIAHVVLVWLVRCVHFHTSVVAALADLGLSGLALAAAIWAAASTASVAVSVWCLFLVQALFVALPRVLPDTARCEVSDDMRFQRAQRSAEAALRRIDANQ